MERQDEEKNHPDDKKKSITFLTKIEENYKQIYIHI